MAVLGACCFVFFTAHTHPLTSPTPDPSFITHTQVTHGVESAEGVPDVPPQQKAEALDSLKHLDQFQVGG